MVDRVTDPAKKVTDPVLLSALIKQGIDKDFVEFFQDYAPRSLGKEHSPYAKFYKDLQSPKRFMVVSGLPMVDADGVKIECGWKVAGINYFSEKNNLFRARVQGTDVELIIRNDQPDGRKANDRLAYKPQLFLNGIEQIPSQAALLPVDPLNPNYLENTLEWDYGIAKRRLRIIEGSILGSWVFTSNPNGEVRIKYNQIGDYRLKLGGFATDNDTEVIPASAFITDEFGRPRQYPFVVSDSATYYPDANPETTSVDGHVQRTSNGDWAALRDGAGTAASPSAADTFVQLNTNASSQWYHMKRVNALFDTSGLADDATISAATLSFYGNTKSSTAWTYGAIDANVYTSAPASNTDLVAADFNVANWGSTALSTAITYANWGTAGYNDFVLNATGIAAISKTGVSKFGLRNANFDVANSQPGAPDSTERFTYVGALTSESGNGYKPKLVVTYTAGQALTKSLADTLTLNDSPSKKPSLNKADTLTLVDSLIKGMGKKPTDTLTFTDSFTRQVDYLRTLTDTLSLADTLIKGMGLSKSDTLTLLDALVKGVSLNKADTLTLADVFTKQVDYLRTLTDTFTLADSFARQVDYLRTLTDTLKLSPYMITHHHHFGTGRGSSFKGRRGGLEAKRGRRSARL